MKTKGESVMKRLFGLVLALAVIVLPSLASARSYHFSSGYGHSYRSYSPRSYSSSHWSTSKYTNSLATKSAYHPYKTHSSYSAVYKSTGFPKVNRSESARHQYLKNLEYDKVPAGYEVDHVVPLSRGGADEPSNMQLLTEYEHHQKTAREQSR